MGKYNKNMTYFSPVYHFIYHLFYKCVIGTVYPKLQNTFCEF